MKKIKSFCKNLLPPIFLSGCYLLIFKIQGRKRWKYGFRSWDDAKANANGYDDDLIIEKVTKATRLVVNGQAIYERDSIVFDKIQYSWPLLASLMLVAATNDDLRVIDFGGGLGTTYRQNSKFIKQVSNRCQWRVVEQEKFVEVGIREFATKNLSFHGSILDAKLDGVDVVIFGGSICYVDNPQMYIAQAIEAGSRYIIFDRTPITYALSDVFSVQYVPNSIYEASFPIRTFSYENFCKQFKDAGYELIEEWVCNLQADIKSTAMGFLFRSKL